MTLQRLARMTRDELVDLVLTDARTRGRRWALGGPRGWSHDELIRYLTNETDLVTG